MKRSSNSSERENALARVAPPEVEPTVGDPTKVEPVEVERLTEIYEATMASLLGRVWGFPKRERWILAETARKYGGAHRAERIAWLELTLREFVSATSSNDFDFGSGFPRALDRWLAGGRRVAKGKPPDLRQSLPTGVSAARVGEILDSGVTDGDEINRKLGMGQ
jgi:hypothetical protein